MIFNQIAGPQVTNLLIHPIWTTTAYAVIRILGDSCNCVYVSYWESRIVCTGRTRLIASVQNCVTSRFELPDLNKCTCACKIPDADLEGQEGIWTADIVVLGDLEINTEGGGGSYSRDPG